MPAAESAKHMHMHICIYTYLYMYIWVVVNIMVPFWGTLNIRGRIIIGIQIGTMILIITHIHIHIYIYVQKDFSIEQRESLHGVQPRNSHGFVLV